MSLSKEAALPAWGYAVAGATGAVLANATVYPLDIVKTRLQVQVKKRTVQTDGVLVSEDPEKQTPAVPEPEHYASTMDAIRKIKKKEGLSGLYAGMPGSLIGVASTNFAYFYWYTFVRTYYISVQAAQGNLSTVAELSLGAVAGALAQLFTIPVAVVTTRQQTSEKENRKDLITTAKDVIGEDGWTGLWSGLKASLVLVVNPAITYGAYQRCRETFYPGKKNLKPMEAFFLGALSKALATFATQPLIVAKVGLQSNPPAGQKKFKSFVEVMKYVIHHEGLLGLYKGIGPQLMKGLLVQGLLMMTKERVELIFLLMYRWLIKKLGK
ncbi:ADP/ATP carrier protein [Orbilia oligospora]|uniref:ADP/ATP carrier protein n=1 Tax=Orbilia oligospora TaxID=2813651 RepID=A0A4Z0Y2R3_ORBOL|nr:ADP/ATP carrier protein [Orbilia oligospora]KAF3179983.1 ADP/ATP carrier protein [Orbilia oligospora]KAF3231104.1 ADP/ATP carrier protein [Orbilia oligospora]KAF3241902.1 ADP/ATP carrier protein [Orbilia oligospora]KAF3247894.1 ADP/ATP carrier protein [Orbilia oligospora]